MDHSSKKPEKKNSARKKGSNSPKWVTQAKKSPEKQELVHSPGYYEGLQGIRRQFIVSPAADQALTIWTRRRNQETQTLHPKKIKEEDSVQFYKETNNTWWNP